jgi:hypothetical protein
LLLPPFEEEEEEEEEVVEDKAVETEAEAADAEEADREGVGRAAGRVRAVVGGTVALESCFVVGLLCSAPPLALPPAVVGTGLLNRNESSSRMCTTPLVKALAALIEAGANVAAAAEEEEEEEEEENVSTPSALISPLQKRR